MPEDELAMTIPRVFSEISRANKITSFHLLTHADSRLQNTSCTVKWILNCHNQVTSQQVSLSSTF
ncbi:hypothetical protein DPMN_095654 [Dreissena polymorpha]|uniref:Uncharacterized protein n=1 Tax=Dreissena polymorpha TaxID=45954 RepID=A0A9D4L6W2_DREPO|nr:hypothetical protein DPMN_095654 [Dreissena polymorpha]